MGRERSVGVTHAPYLMPVTLMNTGKDLAEMSRRSVKNRYIGPLFPSPRSGWARAPEGLQPLGDLAAALPSARHLQCRAPSPKLPCRSRICLSCSYVAPLFGLLSGAHRVGGKSRTSSLEPKGAEYACGRYRREPSFFSCGNAPGAARTHTFVQCSIV